MRPGFCLSIECFVLEQTKHLMDRPNPGRNLKDLNLQSLFLDETHFKVLCCVPPSGGAAGREKERSTVWMGSKRATSMTGRRILLIAIACASSCAADEFERWQQLAPGVRIDWTVDTSTSMLRLKMNAQNAGWVGFGIAEAGGMKGSDIVFFDSGSGILTDSWADGHKMPITDSCQDWCCSHSRSAHSPRFILFI